MRKSFLLFLSVICVIAFSCSDSDDGDDTGDGILSGLTLTSDRSYFSADGVDAVVFTVKDNTGKDVSTQCVYKANDQELVDNTCLLTLRVLIKLLQLTRELYLIP